MICNSIFGNNHKNADDALENKQVLSTNSSEISDILRKNRPMDHLRGSCSWFELGRESLSLSLFFSASVFARQYKITACESVCNRRSRARKESGYCVKRSRKSHTFTIFS